MVRHPTTRLHPLRPLLRYPTSPHPLPGLPRIVRVHERSTRFSFSNELVESLSALSSKPSPHIVLLSKGNSPQLYFEESYLARRMGIAVVKPADLLVREGRVFLKTIGGLEQVDVIYRRIISRTLDPITFGADASSGVPGLINCARKGSVIIANNLGAGVADNKALLRYSDRIIQFYLGEPALLKSVPTYHCADPDQLDHVLAHESTMLLKPIHREGDLSHLYRADRRDEYQEKLRLLLQPPPNASWPSPSSTPPPPHALKKAAWCRAPFISAPLSSSATIPRCCPVA
ncbi:MAG: circularly permuted type 2 ATP-grasp protein [Blastochloris sp.]|nr:circularly permuted type 2 ATP-grasp protein [Blastochloris sp.]